MWAGRPWAFIRGRNSRQPQMTACRLTRMTQSHWASVWSSARPVVVTPALLWRKWIAPKRASAASARAMIWARSPTSVRTASTGIPASSSSAAARVRASSSTSASTMLAPSCPRRRATAKPIPDAPPVTTAVLASNSSMARSPSFRRPAWPTATSGATLGILLVHPRHRGPPRAWRAHQVGRPGVAGHGPGVAPLRRRGLHHQRARRGAAEVAERAVGRGPLPARRGGELPGPEPRRRSRDPRSCRWQRLGVGQSPAEPAESRDSPALPS